MLCNKVVLGLWKMRNVFQDFSGWGDTEVPLCCLSMNSTYDLRRGMKLGRLAMRAVFVNSFKYLQMGHPYWEMSSCAYWAVDWEPYGLWGVMWYGQIYFIAVSRLCCFHSYFNKAFTVWRKHLNKWLWCRLAKNKNKTHTLKVNYIFVVQVHFWDPHWLGLQIFV